MKQLQEHCWIPHQTGRHRQDRQTTRRRVASWRWYSL